MSQSTNKNRGPFLAFTGEWFKKNQSVLLWLLNTPIVRKWFRYVLRIHKDCPIEKIVAIGPNNYVIKGKNKDEYIADFRTHPKFGKRIYFAFKPLWWAIHLWDELVADKYAPQWSYGFSTLTAYPDAGDPGSVTCDGQVARVLSNPGASMSSIRSGSGTTATTSGTTIETRATASNNNPDLNILRRGVYLFDTSALTTGATISAAVLSVYGTAKLNTIGTPELDLVASGPASNTTLAGSDYNIASWGSTVFGSVSYSNFSTTAYNDITLDANGISNISKTAVSKFGSRLAWDINNTAPTNWTSESTSYFVVSGADETGTGQDPKLVVTYTAPTAWTKTVSDTSTTTSSAVRATTKVLSNTLTTTTSVVRGLARTILDTITSTASATPLRTVIKTVIDAITTTTNVVRATTKVLSNTLTTTSSAVKDLARTVSNTVTSTASIVKATTKTILDTVTTVSGLRQLIISLNGFVQDLFWTRQSKNTASWSNGAKNTASWSNGSKNSSTWTNQDKS